MTYENRPSRADCTVNTGDVLFAKMAGTEKTLVAEKKHEEMLFSTGFAVLKPIPEILDSSFLYHILRSEKFLSEKDRLSSGSTQKAITNKVLMTMKISIPPLSEQRRIADILDKAAEIRETSVAIFPLREEAIMSIFQEKFGDTKLNPKGWPLYPLKEIVCHNAIITRGIDQPGENNPDGIPFIRPSDFGEGISRDNLSKCATEIESRYVRSRLNLNDIVITIRATVGTTLLVNEQLVGCNLSRGTARISPGKIADSVFLLYCLRSEGIQRSIQSEITGTTFLQISLKKLREIKIPIPPMNIQESFRKAVQLILSMPDSSELSSTNFQAIKQQLLR